MTDQTADLQLAADFEPATYEAWLALVQKVLKGSDFDARLVSKTLDGIRIAPLYTRADALPGSDEAVPGAVPFTRGARAPGETRAWDIRQFHYGTDPQEANAAILEDQRGGATSLALHIPEDALAAALEGVQLETC